MGFAERLDSWKNAITGLGTALDRATATTFEAGALLDDRILDDLFNLDDLCATACSAYPREALRRGFQVAGPQSTDVTRALRRMGFRSALEEASSLGRAFGGALVVLVSAGANLEAPLAPGETLDRICVYDRRRVIRSAASKDGLSQSVDVRQAQCFEIQPLTLDPVGGGQSSFWVHRSRVVLFGSGEITSDTYRQQNRGWDLSVLQKAFDHVRRYSDGHMAVGNMLGDASVGVMKIHGLLNLIGQNAELVSKRAQILDLGRSVARTLFLDADHGEDYARHSHAWSGLAELIREQAARVSAALRIPLTVLIGVSPGGMNATGESDLRNWYSNVGSFRTNELEPAFHQVLDNFFPGHSVTWPSFWEPTDLEVATLRKTQADTDAVYLQAEALSPEAVVRARFGPDGWTDNVREDPARFAVPSFTPPEDPAP